MAHHLNDLLTDLKDRMARMTALVQQSAELAAQAVLTADGAVARQVVELDQRINDDEVLIERRAIDLLALYQPAASDLRLVTVIIKANGDFERIADCAVNVAQRVLPLVGSDFRAPPDLRLMANGVLTTLRETIRAFNLRDEVLARQVLRGDDAVDALYHQIVRDMLTHLGTAGGKPGRRAVQRDDRQEPGADGRPLRQHRAGHYLRPHRPDHPPPAGGVTAATRHVHRRAIRINAGAMADHLAKRKRRGLWWWLAFAGLLAATVPLTLWAVPGARGRPTLRVTWADSGGNLVSQWIVRRGFGRGGYVHQEQTLTWEAATPAGLAGVRAAHARDPRSLIDLPPTDAWKLQYTEYGNNHAFLAHGLELTDAGVIRTLPYSLMVAVLAAPAVVGCAVAGWRGTRRRRQR